MKQLHRQSSMGKQHRRTSLPRTLASYLFREQRLLFVLLGFLLASSFFLFYPSFTPHAGSGSSATTSTFAAAAVSTRNPRVGVSAAARRLPVGIRQRSLRVVVTGGAGFVGSHLVDKLLARGDSVIVVDNFFTGRKDNVAHHLDNPRFELIRHDVVEPILLEVDQIYHLACPASPVHYKFNPIKTIISFPPHPCIPWKKLILYCICLSCSNRFIPKWQNDSLIYGHKTNVMGTLNMLGLAKRVGARFLLTSTSEVYGDPLEHPQKESYWGHVNPIGELHLFKSKK
jgi:UDP-glucuronate decarboxylase